MVWGASHTPVTISVALVNHLSLPATGQTAVRIEAGVPPEKVSLLAGNGTSKEASPDGFTLTSAAHEQGGVYSLTIAPSSDNPFGWEDSYTLSLIHI